MCHWPVGCLEKHSVWSLVCESLVEQRMLEYVIQALATKHVIYLWNLNLSLPLAQFQASYLLGHDCALKLQWTWGILASNNISEPRLRWGFLNSPWITFAPGCPWWDHCKIRWDVQDIVEALAHRREDGGGKIFFGPTLDHVTWHLNDLPCLAGLDTKISRLVLDALNAWYFAFQKQNQDLCCQEAFFCACIGAGLDNSLSRKLSVEQISEIPTTRQGRLLGLLSGLCS